MAQPNPEGESGQRELGPDSTVAAEQLGDLACSGAVDQEREEETIETSYKSSDVIRLPVNINGDCANALKEIAAQRDVSITEVIRRSIAIMKFVEDETRKGNRIQVVTPEGTREVELIGSRRSWWGRRRKTS